MRKRDLLLQLDPVPFSSPQAVVHHSPTPSSVRNAASANGLEKKALAAWLS